MDHNSFLTALHSPKANKELTKDNNFFGQFTGEWEFDWYGYEPGMDAQHERGEWIFSWILEGRAIQDVWIIPGREHRNEPGMPSGEYGTTVRFYNKKNNVWNVVWIGPVKCRFNIFEARQIEDEIVMEEMNPEDKIRMQWVFSEITDISFNWKSMVSKDDGQTWKLVQKMIVRRKQQ